MAYGNVNVPGALVSKAKTLETARTIRTNLASTSTASFNGSANITPGVTGILPVANGGTGSNSLDSLKESLGVSANTTATVTFSASDWVKDEENTDDNLYTIIIPQTEHLRRNGDFGCVLRHLVDGAPVSNTWATIETLVSYDSATGNVTLTTPDTYDGTALFFG